MDGDGQDDQDLSERLKAERSELTKWRKLKTGARSDYDSIKRDHRGYPIFVKATQLSEGWDRIIDEEKGAEKDAAVTQLEDQDLEDLFSEHSTTPKAPDPIESSSGSSESVAGRGKAVASFYSQLPRDASVEASSNIDTSSTPLHFTPRRIRTVKQSSSDWFIRKATAQLQRQEGRDGDESKGSTPLPVISSNLQSERCQICSATLPSPMTPSQLDAHRLSIAHQLALEGPNAVSDSGNLKKSKDYDEKKAICSGRIILKASNVGYAALERMGWRRGMGLGRDEWEYGLRSGRVRMDAVVERDGKGSSDDAIIIIDSDEDEGQDEDMEIGSKEWLASIEAQQIRLGPIDLSMGSETSKDHANREPTTIEKDDPPQKRPLLEPIAIHKRPDRRGIGTLLPTSSRIVDDKTGSQSKGAVIKATPPGRMTKRKRQELDKHNIQAWKELRMTLN